MKKTLSYIIIAAAIYWLWKSKQNNAMPSPPQLDENALTDNAIRGIKRLPTHY
jgi:hypothetical protein